MPTLGHNAQKLVGLQYKIKVDRPITNASQGILLSILMRFSSKIITTVNNHCRASFTLSLIVLHEGFASFVLETRDRFCGVIYVSYSESD